MPTYRISVPTTGMERIRGDNIVPVESYDLGPKIKAAIACGAFVAFLGVVIASAFTLSKFASKSA